MTFEASEVSIEGGRPQRLYRFRLGVLKWLYTNVDVDVEYASETYRSAAISDNGVRQTGQTSSDEFEITVPQDFPVLRLYRLAPPATEVEVTVWDLHVDGTESQIAFIGAVVGVRRRSPEAAVILCQSDIASLERPGLRLGWSRGCPHTVYDVNCKVSPALYVTEAIVTSMTQGTITAGAWALGDGWFAGGYIEWPIGGSEFDRRGIDGHAGSTLSLIGGSDGITVGMNIKAHPGCARVIQVCNDKFANKDNYGGAPGIPGKSPFDGDPIA